jgi:chromosomal replication initiation ATPase DnaA
MNDLQFVKQLQVAVAKAAGLKDREELIHRSGGSRELYTCKFRDAAIYLARTNTSLGVIRLGELFGGRKASTITAACQREKLRLQRNVPRKDCKTYAAWHASLLAAIETPASEESVNA